MTVDVFLVRHAEAIDETLELRDPMRHLTADGRRQATSLGDRLRWHDCVPTHVWTSPLVRAVQTAELVVQVLKIDVAVDVLPPLAPGESARAVQQAVQSLDASSIVMLVGHEPGMSGVGALLVGAADFEALGKAEAARIVDGQLRWRCAWNADAPVR
jgi:phosphohistidine phosphatase